MNKHEFITQYVLNRACACNGGQFDGKGSVKNALDAWAIIEKQAPMADNDI